MVKYMVSHSIPDKMCSELKNQEVQWQIQVISSDEKGITYTQLTSISFHEKYGLCLAHKVC